ncbi:hypothetical protein GXP67_20090 [Rhodocytophaga rosea]|uniref:DUF1772 domain-containing protein n=1 Tax=Rhodocytophaga rosea TaxID=2704465 RepID=A0A6C0GL96_9BACT|nr:hypothetical protein [Rhodocytophaga rosea]QHT68785.1 hypothetical protein GXP67_20090 [Rhodocytophaga rosea]
MLTLETQQTTNKTFVHTLIRWTTASFIGFTFFSYGTAMMDYFLVYPSRLIVGEKEFVAYHALLEERIVPISVIPFGLLTVLNILLFWFRPASLPRKLVWASFICLLLDWVSTILVQIPINLQLNLGKDEYLIRYIMETNWVRVALESAQAMIALLVLGNIIPGNNARRDNF